MEPDSDYNKKIDAIDLVMTALKAHEKELDDITHELRNVLEELKTGETGKPKKDKRCLKSPVVTCRMWRDFKDNSGGAEMVAYEVEDNIFKVYSLVDGRIYMYAEDLPGKGLRFAKEKEHLFELSYELESDAVKTFLSRELSVSKRKVVEGKIGVGD